MKNICVNDVHPLKVPSSIIEIEDGIDIFVNDKHPAKADFPIDITEDGIIISFFNEQLKKAYGRIVLMKVDMTTLSMVGFAYKIVPYALLSEFDL